MKGARQARGPPYQRAAARRGRRGPQGARSNRKHHGNPGLESAILRARQRAKAGCRVKICEDVLSESGLRWTNVRDAGETPNSIAHAEGYSGSEPLQPWRSSFRFPGDFPTCSCVHPTVSSTAWCGTPRPRKPLPNSRAFPATTTWIANACSTMARPWPGSAIICTARSMAGSSSPQNPAPRPPMAEARKNAKARNTVRDACRPAAAQESHAAQKNVVPSAVARLKTGNDWSLIRAWREHLNISTADMAARLGVDHSIYIELERPRPRPRQIILDRISAALGVTPDQLDDSSLGGHFH